MDTTIAAISTGMTASGISIIRISGPEAFQVADRIFHGKSKKKVEEMKSHTIHYGFVFDEKDDIDEVLLSVMKAPHTFTGEDTVEINCHGGILSTERILETVLKKGALPAEPGEFTKRAFLNGRMDLSKAEAVIGVIEAKNEFALKASVSQLKGAVSEKILSLRDTILDQVSFIEAALDDPEHYDLTGFGEELSKKLVPLQNEIRELLRRADYGTVIQNGIKTCIAGLPNAGKSSVLNLLAGYDRAIVTDIAGTTRDVLEEQVRIGEISLLLMDTAGIRSTEDAVEKIGVNRALESLEKAELVLYVIDSSKGIQEADFENLRRCENKNLIVLFNKSDMCLKEPEKPKETEESEESEELLSENIMQIPFSAKTGEGLDRLEGQVLSMFHADEIRENDEVIITNERHKALLREADHALFLVQEGIEDGMSEEFLTVDLMNAYTSLGRIIGEEVEDDVVNRVFEKFCMGK